VDVGEYGEIILKRRLTAVGIRCADNVTPLYPQKLALTSPTGGGRSVGIVRSRPKAMEFSFSFNIKPDHIWDVLIRTGFPWFSMEYNGELL
jgi:hypothetical protein